VFNHKTRTKPIENDAKIGTLPLEVKLVDMSIKLFGILYSKTTNKHRFQLLQHFSNYIKQTKVSNRLPININIMTALLYGLKGLVESKADLGDEQSKSLALNLVIDALGQPNTTLKCLAADALGRLVHLCNDLTFATNIGHFFFEKLKDSKDECLCIGYSLGLGYLHRFFGGMNTGKNLTSSVSVLFSLSQVFSLPTTVQVWAIHALYLIADSGASVFRSFVEQCVQFIAHSLINVPNMQKEIYLALGKLLGAITTFIGPELQINSTMSKDVKYTCMKACSIMQMHFDCTVKAEAISCIQKLHLFSPSEIDIKTIVPFLIVNSHISCQFTNYYLLRHSP
jgi:hypothetical protein